MATTPQPTQQQIQAAMDAFVQTPEFLALPEGKDRANAYNTAFNALTNGDIPTAGSGLFQSIPGQSGLETALTRAIGLTGMAVVGGALVAGAGAGGAGATGATAAGQTPADFAAGSTVVGGAPAAGAAAGASSTPSILNIAKNLAPVLGGAASAQAGANQVQNQQQLQDANFNLNAPKTRLATAIKSALALAGPETFKFNGPGSGLKGNAVTNTGGYQTPLPADVKNLAQTTINQQVAGANAPPLAPNNGGLGNDLLGGASLGAALLGAFAPTKKPAGTV